MSPRPTRVDWWSYDEASNTSQCWLRAKDAFSAPNAVLFRQVWSKRTVISNNNGLTFGSIQRPGGFCLPDNSQTSRAFWDSHGVDRLSMISWGLAGSTIDLVLWRALSESLPRCRTMAFRLQNFAKIWRERKGQQYSYREKLRLTST